MFKARFLSWSSLTNIPDSSKSVLLRLLDNASGAEEGSSISSQEGSIPALLNELALMVVSLLHRTAVHLSALKVQHWEGVMQDTLSESSEHERHQLERPFKSLFCHISDYLKRCGRHHNLHLLLGLGEAYF